MSLRILSPRWQRLWSGLRRIRVRERFRWSGFAAVHFFRWRHVGSPILQTMGADDHLSASPAM